MKYDIFISYRREGGEYTAKILHDKLTDMGYKVFFDVESLRSGQFNTKLFSVIDECEDFISILSPNCLDRCVNEEDWVRLEISHALAGGKNVVPVLLRGFKFPDQLPADIDRIRYQSGIEASPEFFDAFAKRLLEFLKSKPQLVSRITQNSMIKKVLPLCLALVIVFGAIFTGYKVYSNIHAAFPVTKTEKNLVDEVLYYITQNITQGNVAMMEYDNAIKACTDYLDNPSASKLEELKSDLQNSRDKSAQAQENLVELDDMLSSKLDKTTELSKKDILAVKSFLDQYIDEMLKDIDFMSGLAGSEVLSKSTKTRLLDDFTEELEIEKNLIYYGVNYIFTDVKEEALKDFKTEILPTVPYIYDGQVWRKDKEEIKAITDTEFTKYQNVLMDVSTLVGDEQVINDTLENEADDLQDSLNELDALKEEAKEKFKPLETDDASTLWGKTCRFNTLKMYDMCIECLTMFQDKVDMDEADIFVPILIEFYKQADKTGMDYGCLVGGFDPDKPKSSFYEIGDILIEINGKKIMTSVDYTAAKAENQGSYQVKVLRYNGTDFEAVEGELKKLNDSSALFYDICELPED